VLLSAAASSSLVPRVIEAKGATTLAFPFFLHANPTSFYYSGSQPFYIQLCKLHTTSLYVASLCHKPVIVFIQQMNAAADHRLETSVLLGLNTTARSSAPRHFAHSARACLPRPTGSIADISRSGTAAVPLNWLLSHRFKPKMCVNCVAIWWTLNRHSDWQVFICCRNTGLAAHQKLVTAPHSQ
jgi:hypothetical protein